MVPLLLFLHVGAAIVAFGPTFAFPIIGGMGGREPMFANFATRVSEAIEKKPVLPVALTMPVSGIGLIWFAGVDIFSTRSAWLIVGIVLYTAAILFVIRVQTPDVEKVVELTSRPPDPAAGGPPAELLATIKKVQQGGMALTLAIVVIVFLMVFKPGF